MFSAVVSEYQNLDDRELVITMQRLETLRREVEASLAAVVDVARRNGMFRADGHRSIRGLVKATINCSDGDAAHLVKLGKLVHDIPVVGEQLATGQIGISQGRELARLHANPRCGDQLAGWAEQLLGYAANLPFAHFTQCTRRWEYNADPDGAFKDRETNHKNRTASVIADEGGLRIRATGGTAAQAALMADIFERFCKAEFLTDWDEAVATHGDQTNGSHLTRTDSQRRYDALLAIFEAACGAPLDVRVPEVTVNFVVDQHTFEQHLARSFDGDEGHGVPHRTSPMGDPFRYRCETSSGIQVDPADILAATLIGQVRRVIYDSTGTVIDLGRRRRLFTGSAHQAVMLQATRCVWAGCGIPSTRCQADHSQPWTNDGETAPSNGSPMCGHHNRFKNRGFTTRRTPEGTWHTYRPDGTELTQPRSA